MGNLLTDREFWEKYWENKDGLAVDIPGNYLFHRQLREITEREKISSAIELGGFPGYYAIFLKKYLGIDSTLLDYFVHRGILEQVLAKNGLSANDIGIIEADLFNNKPAQQYDLVLSCGLIEHFEDTKDIIARHLPYLKPGGTLLITLPNFKGVNGWVQKTFDRSNYDKHNISSMNPVLLSSIATELGLSVKRSEYFGGYSIWLENKKEKSALTKAFIKALWLAGKIPAKLFGFESQALSPYIILEARKQD